MSGFNPEDTPEQIDPVILSDFDVEMANTHNLDICRKEGIPPLPERSYSFLLPPNPDETWGMGV